MGATYRRGHQTRTAYLAIAHVHIGGRVLVDRPRRLGSAWHCGERSSCGGKRTGTGHTRCRHGSVRSGSAGAGGCWGSTDGKHRHLPPTCITPRPLLSAQPCLALPGRSLWPTALGGQLRGLEQCGTQLGRSSRAGRVRGTLRGRYTLYTQLSGVRCQSCGH